MSNKHDANVRKSTLVNFQIGLIASLLCTYVVFEMYTKISVVEPPYIGATEIKETEFTMDDFKVESVPKKETIVKKKPVKKPDWTKPKIGDKEVALKNLKSELEGKTNPKILAPVIPVDSIMSFGGDDPIEYPIDKVTVAPIYPGCEQYYTNEDRIACFSSKIRRLVSKKFNAGLGEEYGLKGLQRIHVQFQVDTDGVIKDVKVRAPHPALEKETRRVVKKFSNMEPGKIENKPVKVKYILPIVFKVVN